MAALNLIRWLPNGPDEDFAGSNEDYYVLGESDVLALKAVPVWCHQCGRIELGEDVSSLERIDRDIRDLHDSCSDLYKLTTEYDPDGATRWLGTLERRRRWRAGRQAPPKCVECGSVNIIILPFDEPVRVPSGTLELRAVGFCRLAGETDRFFTTEGDRIVPPIRRDWRRAVLRPWWWFWSKVSRLGSPAI